MTAPIQPGPYSQGVPTPEPPASPQMLPAGYTQGAPGPYTQAPPHPYAQAATPGWTAQPSPYTQAAPTYPPAHTMRYVDGSTEKNAFNSWALALSIVGLCCAPTAIAGLVMGFLGRQYAREDRATNGGVATAAFIIGIIVCVLWVIGGIMRLVLGVAILSSPDVYY